MSSVNTPYDDVFRTLLVDCKGLIIPVVNEVFGEHFTGKEKVVLKENEIFLRQQDGDEEKRITDSSFAIVGIGGESSKQYHLECQSTADGSMLIRMYEYDSQIALKEGVLCGTVLNVHFPQSAILYLRHNSETPDELKICINTPGGSVSYPVMVMKVKEYDIDEIFEKNLLFLIPFYIFCYENRLEEINEDTERLRRLKGTYEEINERLEQRCMTGILDRYTKTTICEMSQKVIEALANKYANIRKEVAAVMGGKVLEHKAKDIYRQGETDGKEIGLEIGKEIGLEIGLDALVNTLKDMFPDADAVHKEVIKNEAYQNTTLERIKKYYKEPDKPKQQ